MKYECKENDCLIEMGKDRGEILISVMGETAKTIIGLKDLNQALILFGVVLQIEQLNIEDNQDFIDWRQKNFNCYRNLERFVDEDGNNYNLKQLIELYEKT